MACVYHFLVMQLDYSRENRLVQRHFNNVTKPYINVNNLKHVSTNLMFMVFFIIIIIQYVEPSRYMKYYNTWQK